jgi:hypothetical protein
VETPGDTMVEFKDRRPSGAWFYEDFRFSGEFNVTLKENH